MYDEINQRPPVVLIHNVAQNILHKNFEIIISQTFSKTVSNHAVSKNMLNFNFLQIQSFLTEIHLYVKMFGPNHITSSGN